jgi:exonuclease SbcD
MRILHTSDWHLGQTLHDLHREEEHAAFLSWLLDRAAEHDVDALVITGDIFESSNPPAQVQRTWYRFLADAGRRRKGLQVVAIAGNHDSAARLEAPRDVLQALDVHVIGDLPRERNGFAADKAIVPLTDQTGVVKALVAAVPFLRASDVSTEQAADFGEGVPGEATDVRSDPLIEGVRKIYAEAAAALRSRQSAGQAIILTGHLYTSGTKLSDLSERKILGGNLHALPADIFTPDISYVALGHLHFPQRVGGRENVRYAGAPIPLSLGEADYPHQVVLVEFDGEYASRVEPIKVPRLVNVLRLPEEGPEPKDVVLSRLRKLPDDPDPRRAGPDLRPYLEVRVLYPASDITVKSEIEKAVEGKNARLVKVDPPQRGTGEAASEQVAASLSEVTPEEVFRMKHARDVGGAPAVELLSAFNEILVQAEEGRDA